MYKLIRDNLPEIAKENGNQINYATAQTDDFFKTLLRGKLVDAGNDYLASDSLEALAEIRTVIDYLTADCAEEFQQTCNKILTELGGYDKRYIGFFVDPAPVSPSANTTTK
jgi:predicted house-cleaning noncanonical NTP pyrophosphatase (MazG superfamily)